MYLRPCRFWFEVATMTDQAVRVAALNIVLVRYGGTLDRWRREKAKEEEWQRIQRNWKIRKPIWERELANIRNNDPNGMYMAKYNYWWETSGRPMQ